MLRLLYTVDYAAAPLDLVAQVVAVLRIQEFARRAGLRIEESRRFDRREFTLGIPPDRMNDVLWDLDLEGLLTPILDSLEGIAFMNDRHVVEDAFTE